jgi:hypothetical protein
MKVRLMLVVCVVLALTVGISTASGGNSDAAKACQKGGWQHLYRSGGTGFKNQGDCVSYAAQGGTLTQKSPAQLVCESVGGTYGGPSGNVLWSCPNGPYSNAAFDALTSQCMADSGGHNWSFSTDGTYFTGFVCYRPV